MTGGAQGRLRMLDTRRALGEHTSYLVLTDSTTSGPPYRAGIGRDIGRGRSAGSSTPPHQRGVCGAMGRAGRGTVAEV